MTDRAVIWAATGLGVAVMLLLLAPLGALGLSFSAATLTVAEGSALRFTLWQSVLSAGISVVLAVPVARALARRRFVGREVLIATLGAPFILPVIVAVLGLLAVFGRAGWVNGLLATLGLPAFSIYGLQGVVLAHVFFNMPLAVRMILHGWQAIPTERFRLAQSLGFSPRDVQRHIEWPMLRAVLPGAALVIFVICLTSFAVALTLGGGPRATTVELAIYQAVRFDFDLPTAARLALLQFGLCALAFLVAARVALPSGFGAGGGRIGGPPAPGGWHRAGDVVAITFAALFLALPLGAVVLRGVPGLPDLPGQVWAAAGRSLGIALASTAVSIGVALVFAMAAARGRAWPALAATLPLAASSLVLGTGLFLLLQPYVRPSSLALPVTFVINAALSLPFAFRILAPEARSLYTDYHRLSQSLGLTAWARLRWVVLPRLSRPLGFAAGLVAALSMGDLGVIALFAGDAEATLPLIVHRLMGAYRMDQAAAAALLLVALSFALFWIFDHWGRRYAAA
jgi:thiamine transport system permease protein